MSHQLSPGSSTPLNDQSHTTSYYRDENGLPVLNTTTQPHSAQMATNQPYNSSGAAQTIQAPAMPAATSSSRTKSKAYHGSIAAGAEDLKYAAKYKDLKRKVREIEADNDKLQYKVLQAKRNIQRAKLERAILYERLGSLPATPPPANAQLPQQGTQQVSAQAPPLQHHGRVDQPPPNSNRRSYNNRQAPSSHHYQQPIQPAPAPPTHVSPPQHHAQAHTTHALGHHPHASAHPGQMPITQAQRVTTVATQEGPLVVVAGPDGAPVYTADRRYIPVDHGPDLNPAPRKRGVREKKDVREARERDAREREMIIAEREHLAQQGAPQGAPPIDSGSGSRSHPGHMSHQSQPQDVPHNEPLSSYEQRERDYQTVNHRSRDHGNANVHGHRYQGHQTAEQASPPQPPSGGQGISPIQSSPPNIHTSAPGQVPRSHSHTSQYSSSSQSHHPAHHHHHHRHGHSHSQSHSGSPHSPGSGGGPTTSYPSQRTHGHQRIGPGSYVLRDRGAERDREIVEEEQVLANEAASGPREPATGAPASTPPPVSTPAPVPPRASAPPRVPTPPFYGRDGVVEPVMKSEMGDGYISDDAPDPMSP